MNNEEFETIKEFNKRQLSNLISDLRDINTYTSFKNGAFIYDLGKYKGDLLVNYIEQLEQRIDKAIEYIDSLEDYPMLTRYNCLEILEILKGKE